MVRRSAPKILDKALTLLSEGGPNFGVRHYPKSLGMSWTFGADLRMYEYIRRQGNHVPYAERQFQLNIFDSVLYQELVSHHHIHNPCH